MQPQPQQQQQRPVAQPPPQLHQLIQQQQQQQQQQHQQTSDQKLMTPPITPMSTPPNNTTTSLATKRRPLSISSISSAASSGSSSSAYSSNSSGVQSSLTRNSSLNYGTERSSAYLASIESLNTPPTPMGAYGCGAGGEPHLSIEAALKNLNLSTPPGTFQFKDAAARAAVLEAGAQSRGFGAAAGNGGGTGASGNRTSRINRSLHASLRYDKKTAYRIHLMANARALLLNTDAQHRAATNEAANNNDHNDSITSDDSNNSNKLTHRNACISRNSSSISSDSGSQHHHRPILTTCIMHAITEIIETERTYVDDLEQIVTGYICYLRKHEARTDTSTAAPATNTTTTTTTSTAPATTNADGGAIISASHIEQLFSNLEDIYKFNKDLMFRLEECYLNPSSVAECFVENSAGFEVYTNYCTMYPQVVSTLTELMGNQASAQLLKERQQELNQSLPLGAYLLKPVQRILKYHILFQRLIKHANEDDTVDEKDRQLIGEAFSVMTSIACHINEMKKRHEHAIRVHEVQGLLCGWEGPDLTSLGELILEDTFKLYNRPKSERHLFLFDSVLLMTKKKRDGSLHYKGHIACSNLMLIENIEGQPLVFNTVPFDNPKALCAFQARNLDKKRSWCLQMKEVIIKSFEVKIPVHVRDILMSLTNSSNVTETSPKSSSESARVLRAPNYLEKKRAKTDKKN